MPIILGVWSILRPSVHRVDNSGPLCGTKHSQLVPRVGVGANYFRWGQLEYLRALAVLWEYVLRGICTARNMYCEYSHYLKVLNCGYCLYSTYFGVRYCGYTFTCALGVPYCSYSQHSQYLSLLSTRSILAASTLIISVLGRRVVLEHLSVKPSVYSDRQVR